VAGEVLEHAFAGAVVGGFEAEGEGVTGAFGRLDLAAVYGDHLAEFREVVGGGLFQGADAVLADDLADLESRLGSLLYGTAANAGTESGGGQECPLFQRFGAKCFRDILLQYLGFFGDARQEVGEGIEGWLLYEG
jgi:hypothetical protein